MIEHRTTFEAPKYVGVLLGHVYEKIARDYWRTHQQTWDGISDPEIEGVMWRPIQTMSGVPPASSVRTIESRSGDCWKSSARSSAHVSIKRSRASAGAPGRIAAAIASRVRASRSETELCGTPKTSAARASMVSPADPTCDGKSS